MKIYHNQLMFIDMDKSYVFAYLRFCSIDYLLILPSDVKFQEFLEFNEFNLLNFIY